MYISLIMDQVMNNNDLRGVIFENLRKKPEPLAGFAEYHSDFPENPKLGDVIETINHNKIFMVYCGMNGEYISNSNKSKYPYGNLVIPIEVTQYIINAVEYYKNIINEIPNFNIELRWDDIFITHKFGDLPNNWEYSLDVDRNILSIIFDKRRNIYAEFIVDIHNTEDIFNFYKGAFLKQTRIYMYFQKEGKKLRISLSNQLDDDQYNFFEFYVKKYSYEYDSALIVKKWFDDTEIKNNYTYLPINWRPYFIRAVNNPNDNYFCIEYKGPLYNRMEVLNILKKRFDYMFEKTSNKIDYILF